MRAVDMKGRCCLVTGASSGIGLATATGLARRGAEVILLCRDPARGAAALATVRAANPDARAELLLADLASQAQVRCAVAEFRKRFDALHVLILNAAHIAPERVITEDGQELQFAVNHLSGVLLTQQLLPMLRASAPARVVVVASQVEAAGVIDFDDLTAARSYAPLRAYTRSKLANVMYTYELAERLAGTGITANCLHPGVVRTRVLDEFYAAQVAARPVAPQLLRAARAAVRAARGVAKRALRRAPPSDWALSPEEGAAFSLQLACDPALTKTSGVYFKDGAPAVSSPQSRDREARRRLWELSLRAVGLDEPIPATS